MLVETTTPVTPRDDVDWPAELGRAARADGRPLSEQERLETFRRFAESGRLLTTEPLLPLLLSLKGRPYTLRDHFPFAPVFRTRMPVESTIKSGRQVAKTTSLAASGLMVSGSIPHTTTLYVTPLFEQVRKFSSNYIGDFIAQSPVQSLWRDPGMANSVLQRTFKNHSKMHFGYAWLSADRLRGIPADFLNYDESVSWRTTVDVLDGGVHTSRRICDLLPGDLVLSYDTQGKLLWSPVRAVAYHGCRLCFRLTTARGYQLDATAESYLATDFGWRRLSQVITDFIGVGPTMGSGPARPDGSTDATRPRDDVGGRCNVPAMPRRPCPLPEQSRVETGGVQLDQVPDLVRVRRNSAQEEEERRLRRLLECIRHPVSPGVRLLVQPDMPGRQEVCHSGMVGGDRPGWLLGMSGLVDRRRWHAIGDGLEPGVCVQHTRVLAARGRPPGGVVDGARACRLRKSDPDPRQDLSGRVPHDSGDDLAVADCWPVRPAADAVQGRPDGQGHDPVLRDLQYRDRRDGAENQPEFTALLRETRVQAGAASDRGEEVRRDAGGAGEETCGGATPPREAGCGEDSSRIWLPGITGTGLVADPIIAIECIGTDDVYDIEVEGTRTFLANGVAVHNCQDIDTSHFGVIGECLSASPWKVTSYRGTPKTMDGPLEVAWQQSSQAEWVIPCGHCTEGGRPTRNIPSLEYHLDDMIGPYRDDISEARPAVICHACRGPIDPRAGRWRHRYRERRWDNAGYHAPQIIMPMHYADPAAWAKLLVKRESMAPYEFYNEICGESFDTGAKLMTLADLKAAATLPWKNPRRFDLAAVDDEVMRRCPRYRLMALGADWGGGRRVAGKLETSFTALSLVGMRHDGRMELVWGARLMTPHDHIREAMQIRDGLVLFRPHLLPHDFTGAGSIREGILKQLGFPAERIMAMDMLARPQGAPVRHVPPDQSLVGRHYYQADRTRIMVYTLAYLRSGQLTTFEYDYASKDQPGLLHDFLALVDEHSTPGASGEIYMIKRQQGFHDDFAWATAMACAALWHATDSWPTDLAGLKGAAQIHPDQVAGMGPPPGEFADMPPAWY